MFNTTAPFLVDLFLLLLLVLLPVMVAAVLLVRRGRIRAHATIMAICFVAFLAGVIAFEVEVQFGESGPPLAPVPLVIHLCFAVPSLLLWTYQIANAGKARTAPAPHRKRGRLLLALLLATITTGAWLYLQTFSTVSG